MRPGLPLRVLPYLLLAAHALAYVLWTEDDAAISLRYVSNLVAGEGLVYNPGERVEAISNLGWVLLLAPLHALPGPTSDPVGLLVAAKGLGVVLAMLTLAQLARLGRACGLSGGAIVAAQTVAAASAAFAGWAISGMETPAVVLASTTLLADAAQRAADEKPGGAVRLGAAASALILLRVDGFVLVLIVFAALTIASRRLPPRAALVGAGITLGATLLYRQLYYGRWLPLPVAAKVDVTASVGRLADTWVHYLWPFLLDHGALLLAVAGLTWAALPGERSAPRRVAALFTVGLFAYVVLVGRDWMPLYRFLVPAVVPLAVLAMGAMSALLARLPRPPGTTLRAALIVGLVAWQGLAGWSSFRQRRGAPIWYLHPTSDPQALVSFWTPAVDWLAANARPDDLLLTSEAGFIPYLSGLRTLDSYGLATPAIADLPRGSVVRSTLGVETRFTADEPSDAAQEYLAAVEADVVILQARMLRIWNDGKLPDRLLDRYTILQPPAGAWAIYAPRNATDDRQR